MDTCGCSVICNGGDSRGNALCFCNNVHYREEVVMERRCDKCEWWFNVECRRFPPCEYVRIETHSDRTVFAKQWPITKPDDWCGEFNPKAESTPKPLEVADAVKVLTARLREDAGFYGVYKANIARSFLNEWDDGTKISVTDDMANAAADRFLQQWIKE